MATPAVPRPHAATDVTDITDLTDVDAVDTPETLRQRRRRAVREAAQDAVRGTMSTDPDTPAVALRCYGPGCVAVAVAGRPSAADVAHLRALRGEIDRLATDELVVDCTHLAECGAGLARTIAGVRIRRLSDGARVELHDPPPALQAAVGQNPPSEYVVTHDPTPSRRIRGATRRRHPGSP